MTILWNGGTSYSQTNPYGICKWGIPQICNSSGENDKYISIYIYTYVYIELVDFGVPYFQTNHDKPICAPQTYHQNRWVETASPENSFCRSQPYSCCWILLDPSTTNPELCQIDINSAFNLTTASLIRRK